MKRFSTFRILSLLTLCFLDVSIVQADYEVEVRTHLKIPMRDGTKLDANIFLPKAQGKFPVLLLRTPYGKGNEKLGDGLYFGARGYVVVCQDCRGRGGSEGKWDPFRYDSSDGQDTYKWLVEQPWSNGEIGTLGGSYLGFTQWVSAPWAGPHLKAMFPVAPLIDPYSEACYNGGAFNLSLAMGWGALVSYQIGEKVPKIDWNKAFRTLPLSTWDEQVTGREVDYLRLWLAHPYFDRYWAKRSARNRWHGITVPICSVDGWYDIFAKGVLKHTNAVMKRSISKDAQSRQHLIMGPGTHGLTRDGKVGDLDFGKNAVVKLREMETQWFDHWLKGKKTGVENWPPFRIFVMGRNEWRDEQEWPLARTQYTPYYLHSNGSANTLNGDGTLDPLKPGNEPSDTFVYDPNDPVPTLGGCNLFGCPAGPHDQRKVEKQKNVLVYTSAALNEDLEVTGPVRVALYAASTAPDTDWTAKLVDVHPDGLAINLCDGIIRARCRESVENPTLIKPGKIYGYDIDLWVTSNVFLAGHRIRVEISSSNFPRFDRNPNTGHPFGADDLLQKATQTVYHDKERLSYISLPVIPGS